ncbi:MAG: DUF3343 domain-containing protein [Desulfovibrionaceae bacterium]
MNWWKHIWKSRKGALDTGGAELSAPSSHAAPKGIAVFAHTGEVIRAEMVLRTAGLAVEVKGPPPHLRTGCDLVVVYNLLQELRVREVLEMAGVQAEAFVHAGENLLDPVSLFQVKDLGAWLMVRAANMKITVCKDDGRIVNISGGGCPDVPYLAAHLTGLTLTEAQEPRHIGQTLCCYSLQKAFEEARRLLSSAAGAPPCGS